jgi:protein ImuA
LDDTVFLNSLDQLEMSALPAIDWLDDDSDPPEVFAPKKRLAPGELPLSVAAAIWRGDQLGSPISETVSSGWAALDAELPGGGWPCRSLTEVLQPQPSVCEWRLIAPAITAIVAAGKTVVIVGPARHPHLPGLRFMGFEDKQLVWVQVDSPAQRLWTTEQLIKSNAFGALVSWLPQARQEQIRRLQICAQSCEGPVFLCRPAAAEQEASAAPLRVQLTYGPDWELRVHLFKRKGPTHEGVLCLPSIPGGLASIITPRLSKPSELLAQRVDPENFPDVVGSPASRRDQSRRVAAH